MITCLYDVHGNLPALEAVLVDRLGAIVWEAIPGDRPGEAIFTFVSEATETLLGYPADRWLGDRTFWFQMIHPDDRDRVNAEIAAAARGGCAPRRRRARHGRPLRGRLPRLDGRPDAVELPGRPAIVSPPHTAPRRALELSGLVGVLDVRDI